MSYCSKILGQYITAILISTASLILRKNNEEGGGKKKTLNLILDSITKKLQTEALKGTSMQKGLSGSDTWCSESAIQYPHF